MKLTLDNFQIHYHKEVEIPDGVTTYIEGDSDTGKSACLRAIRWVCENKPDAGMFVTLGSPRGTEAIVTLETEDCTVVRARGKSKNRYVLDGEEFTAFGREVPPQISKKLRLSPYTFQLQGEPPFLIAATPTEAAKILADAAGLGVIDAVVGRVREEKRKNDAECRMAELMIENAKREKEEADAKLPLAATARHTAQVAQEYERLTKSYTDAENALFGVPVGKEVDLAPVMAAYHATKQQFDLVKEVSTRLASAEIFLRSKPAQAKPDNWLDSVKTLCSACTTKKEQSETCNREFGAVFTTLKNQPPPIPDGGVIEQLHHLYSAVQMAYNDVEAKKASYHTAFSTVLNAPKGKETDTSVWIEMRKAIKVCPTCGREM